MCEEYAGLLLTQAATYKLVVPREQQNLMNARARRDEMCARAAGAICVRSIESRARAGWGRAVCSK